MEKENTQFRINRVKQLSELYSDESATNRKIGAKTAYKIGDYKNAADVRSALAKAADNRKQIVETSNQLYAVNPVYSSVMDYLSNMFMWRYKVIPHKVYTKSKRRKTKDNFDEIYNLMLEVVDGLSIETKFPSILAKMYINGGVYFTTYCDTSSITIQTMILPDAYCEKIGETQYGTNIIRFDYSYFDSLGLDEDGIKSLLKSFPEEMQKAYKKYKKNDKLQKQILDPHYSSAVLMNDLSIPTYFYLLGSILNYEKYEDIELQRRENMLKYLVVHTMPIYQDQLVFEVDEVKSIHNSLRRIVDTNDNAKLVTTYGDMHVENIGEKDTAENDTLNKTFKTIFDNAAFNSALFTGETATSLEASLIRDKGKVWKYVQEILNFYTIAINNWFDFKTYQADIEILPISSYTYKDDIKIYKDNATLGVGKLDYLIASGIKQKNIQDNFDLEKFLNLEQITPMQTSYTQTAEDREVDSDKEKDTSSKEDSNESSSEDGIEPSSKEEKTQVEPTPDDSEE